jgi:hypothetical protein
VPTSHRIKTSGNKPYDTKVITAAVMLGSVAAMTIVTYNQAIATTYTLLIVPIRRFAIGS